jgi:hypothetical protein
MRESRKQERGDAADKSAAIPQTFSESTTEITTENGGVVRDALVSFGLTRAVVDQLAQRYAASYLLGKLDLVQWLVATRSPLVEKNPAGYLRRAIEEDYAAPPGYQTPAQRQAEATERERRQAAIAEAEQRAAEAEARARAVTEQELAAHYPPRPIPGTNLTTTAAWQETLTRLEAQLSRLNFETWLQRTALASCRDGHAVVIATSRFQAEGLAERLDPRISPTLSTVLGLPVQCQYQVFTDSAPGDTGEDAAAPPSPPASAAATPRPRRGRPRLSA